MGEVTAILETIQQGARPGTEELIPLVYEELRHIAASRMARERPGQTIQATELVHEAYLRLVGCGTEGWEGRGHFFAAAGEAMRRILIERARRKGCRKRGGHMRRVDIEVIQLPGDESDERLLALHEVLERLESLNASAATLVKLRFFVGLTQRESAEALGISRATADNRWAFARAWLYRALKQAEGASG